MANELKTDQKAQAVSMLWEGNSIRAVERMTGIHRDTVMRLGVRNGQASAKIMDEKMRVQVVVSQLHNCGATRRGTVPVNKVFRGQAVWQEDVKVFDLHGHPKAKRAYAWSHLDGDQDERERFVAVLEIPPVDSAQRAVQVQIVKDVKGIK